MIPEYTQKEAQIEGILGNDAPEEFLCMITYSLMKEPVRLPTSDNVCDRSSMQRILLNDEHDPFNRAPLKYADLIPDLELKQRIERWIEQKLAGVQETDEDLRKKNKDKDVHMESPDCILDKRLEEEKVNEDDYTSAFFDDDQLTQLRGATSINSQNDIAMLSQQSLSNFMARGDRFGYKPDEDE